MRAIGLLLRLFAFLFNLVTALGLFFLALLVIPGGRHNLSLPVVPLEDRHLTYTLLGASIYAFVSMVLALRRGWAARFSMLLWNLVVAAMLLMAPFRASFSFQNPQQWTSGLYVLLAALAALWGSWLQFRSARVMQAYLPVTR